MKKKLSLSLIAVAAILAAACGGAGALHASAATVKLVDPLGGQTFQTITKTIINFIINAIAIPVATIMVLVGAFQMITSSGDPEKTTKGRKTLLWAAIGLAVAFLASGVATLIQNILINGQ